MQKGSPESFPAGISLGEGAASVLQTCEVGAEDTVFVLTGKMVEAAGVEPSRRTSVNRLMAPFVGRFSQRTFSVELVKKTQERSGHLVWRLLLNPVAFTVNNGGASKVCAVRSRPSVKVNAR